jgi:hypothetical protein
VEVHAVGKKACAPCTQYTIQILDGEEPTVGSAAFQLPTSQTSLEVAKGTARRLYVETRHGWRGRRVFGVCVIDENGKSFFEKNFVSVMLTDDESWE